MKKLFFVCTALTICLLNLRAADSPISPNRNRIVVYQSSRSFDNGYSTLPRSIVVDRPKVGTYVQGVVRVKTRAMYGVHTSARVINGSPANTVLSAVGMNSVTSAFTSAPSMASADQAIEKSIGLDRIYDIQYSDAIDPFDLCMRLMESPDVEYAVPVQIHTSNFVPNDPRYSSQAWLKTMKMEQAWDVTKGSKSIVIAIVDSGTDYTHEDLADQIYTNPGEIANNSIDDDNNGLVDDFRGWDFVGNVTISQAQQGILLPDNDPKVNYPVINGNNGHGTITAGCAAASTNNAKGVASTGFNCTIIPIKCGADNPNIGAILSGYPAIKYAADLGADIINCSWGGQGEDPSAQDIIDYANAKGSLVVAASGNNGVNSDEVPHNPANLFGVLSVGSTNNNDRVSSFSNYGWGIDVLAPGEAILSTFPGNRYQAFDGTSFSCPLTAGVAALIKTLHPTWTPQMIRQQIRSTSDQLSTVSQANRPLYYGRTNAENAVKFNNSFSSGNRVPGITISALSLPGNAITSYAPTSVGVTLSNLLADAPNTTLLVAVRSAGATVSPIGNQNLGLLLHDESKELSFTIQLAPNFPWYESEIELGLTIQSGSYVNYVLVSVPVRLPTQNSHRLLAVTPSSAFGNIDYTTDGAMWSTGYVYATPAYVVGSASGVSGFNETPYLATALSGITGSRAVIGGMQSGVPSLSLTTNTGNNWSTTSVSSSMASVAFIRMFDATTGLAIGNPVGNKLGIARSINGGNSWQPLANAPAVSSASEKFADGSGFSLGDNLWFGTTNGRIVFTTNKGGAWAGGSLGVNGAVIVSIAFKDDNNGVLLYRTSSSSNAPYRIASTVNGGLNWTTNVFDPTTLGITSMSVQSPGGHFLLIGANGEVFGSDNNGVGWQIILSKPSGELYCATSVRTTSNYLFMGSDIISLLQYRYSGPSGTKILGVTNANVDFGTVSPGQNRQRYVTVSSSGESDVTVDSVVITPDAGTPDTAFRISIPLDQVVESGTTDQLGIRFYSSTDTGTFQATVAIYSNSTPPTTTARLTARVQRTSSVDELSDVSLLIAPNPAGTDATIQFSTDATASMFNLAGELVGTWQLAASVPLRIDLHGVPMGHYVLRMTTPAGSKSYPMLIVR